jgi:hypothetical protein
VRGKLRAELLAATRTAGAEHLAATSGRFAGEKAVTTGAHEIAGLERPLHIILEKFAGQPVGQSPARKPWPQSATWNRPAPLWESRA